MNKRNFLFARPSFLKGVGSILNIGATGKVYNSARSVAEADLKAIRSDWKIIGNDMREALDEYKTQTSAKPKR